MMEKYGLRLLRNGYNVIPITPGGKAPGINHWQKVQTTEEHVRRWQSNGFADAGIGITTGTLVFIDLDIPNDGVEIMVKWCYEVLGIAPARIGNAPKLGLLYRSEVPIPTRISSVYFDASGQRCCIEILGLGRQFVAYAIHPDTGMPYLWDKGFNPLVIRAEDLPVVKFGDVLRIFERLNQLAIEKGWTSASTSQSPLKSDTPLKKYVCGYSDPKIRAYLMQVPNDNRFEAREDWMKIGFAVHHETGGSEFGRELWLEWSEQHHSHNDQLFDKAWASFGRHAEDHGYREVTFRYIVQLAGIVTREKLDDLLWDIDIAVTTDELEKVALAAKDLILKEADRERLVIELRKAWKRMGSPRATPAIREMLKPALPEGTPDWLEGWVFLTHTGQFYHRERGQHVDRAAFDMAHNRYIDDISPSRFAMRVAKIPVFHMGMYLPGVDETFRDVSGLDWVNTYRDTAPEMPAECSPRDLANIKVVEDHFTHLFGDDQRRDIEILISTLAYIVQTGRRVNWLTLIQGAEQIGKTYLAYLMSTVLGGAPHVHTLDTGTLMSSTFTDFAQGHQVVYVEEIKVHGKRFDVMDKLKPYVTNDTISIHPKGFKQYTALNTATYFGFTNYRDAIPVTEGDTRYFILLSQWQDSDAVANFKRQNPDYYKKLFAALEQSPGALRRWLIEWKLHPDFDPAARAPHSQGKATVIDEGKTELQTQIEDLIDAKATPGVSRDLLIIHLLTAALGDDMAISPPPAAIGAVLRRLQFVPIKGRRVKISGQYFFCWTKNPSIRALNPGVIREQIIREIIKNTK
jgi:hypothetical protein